VTGYRNVVREFRRDPGVGRFRLAFFVVGVVYSFTEAGFRMLLPIWITFLLTTLAVPGGWTQSKTKSPVELETVSLEPAPSLEKV